MELRTLLIFLAIFTVLVFVHELGHYLTARLTGMRVLEFGFGFPPRAFRIRHAGIDYSVNWIPFGGFVRIFGEDGAARTPDGEPLPDSFSAKPVPARALVLVAGVLMNVLLAAVVYTLVFSTGAPGPFSGKLRWNTVEPGSPADVAGFKPGDAIVRIDGRTFRDPEAMVDYIYDRAGNQIRLTVERGGQTVELQAVPRTDPPQGQGPLGLRGPEPIRDVVRYPVPEAAMRAVQRTGFMVQEIGRAFASTIGGLVGGRGTAEPVTGPIGIFTLTGQVIPQGPAVVFELTALLSLNLAIINIIPFPGLDGGRLLFVLLEAVRGGRRLDPRTEAAIHAFGFVMLLFLVFVVSYFDIRRLAGG